MKQDTFIAIAGLAIIFSTLWFLSVYFGDRARMRRIFKRISYRKIINCKDDDIVLLSGYSEVLTTAIASPLSNSKCIYYKVIVEKKEGRNFQKIIHDEKGINFIIRDREKIAVISTYKVSGFMVEQLEYSSGFLRDATSGLENYLKRFGYSSSGFLGFNNAMRYYESIIPIGSQVVVAGKVKWVPGSKVGLPGEEKILYVKAMNEKHPLYLSADLSMLPKSN